MCVGNITSIRGSEEQNRAVKMAINIRNEAQIIYALLFGSTQKPRDVLLISRLFQFLRFYSLEQRQVFVCLFGAHENIMIHNHDGVKHMDHIEQGMCLSCLKTA